MHEHVFLYIMGIVTERWGGNVSLRIISGRAGTGKTSMIHREIVHDLKTNPLGSPIFIIVPDQMSFSTEYELTNNYEIEGIMRAQVMSFKRLAWFVLQQMGGIARERINGMGYRMLIRRILDEHKDEFELFKQAAGKRGFTEEVGKILKEFSQYNITADTIGPLMNQLQQQGASDTLLKKLHDLDVIMQQLKARIGSDYVDGDSYVPVLLEQLPKLESLRETHIYLDGFVSFTGQEFTVLRELIKYAARVTIVMPFENAIQDLVDGAVFQRAAKSYDKLLSELMNLRQEGIVVELEETVQLTDNHRAKTSDLLQLEQGFFAPTIDAVKAQGHVQIFEATSLRAEVQSIAQEINRLVLEEGVRYRDIGILYRQADVYDAIIGTTFYQYDIPVFSNEKRSMLYHPLIEFSRSVLEIITSNWQYEPIFRSVKTDLFSIQYTNLETQRYKFDQLENFVIAKGIVGRRWFDDYVWSYRKFKSLDKVNSVQTGAEEKHERLLHEARDLIRGPVQVLEDKLKKAKTGRDMIVALYELMEELDVYQKLVKMQEQEESSKQGAKIQVAHEHEQAWNGWVGVLEQFDFMFGDKKMTINELAQILEEGFESLQFASVPPLIDEVTVSTIEFSRFDNMKVIFIIGVNDGVYPMRVDAGGLLSDEDRALIEETEFELAPSTKSKLLQESFLFYRAISSPTHRLYVTFTSADEESKGKLPSLYINRLHKLFEVNEARTLPHTRFVIDPIEELEEEAAWKYLRHPAPSIGFLLMQMKKAQLAKKPLPPRFAALYAFYERDEKWKERLAIAMTPFMKTNAAEPLNEELTTQLYGEDFQASVSRIEQYYSCPYAHFASYGLKLSERTEFRLESFAVGDLFHEALRKILSDQGEPIPPNNFAACLSKAEETINELAEYFSYSILKSSARFEYIKVKLIKIVARTIYALLNQNQYSKFVPIAHEKPFGKRDEKTTDEEDKNRLEPLEIKLDHDRKMYVRGQIDRIDAHIDAKTLYLRVIDYKSSGRTLNFTEVYNGISLQLLTYLDVAMQNIPVLAKSNAYLKELSNLEQMIVQAAGMFYVHVHNPILSLEDYTKQEKIETERQASYKMSGYLLKDTQVAQWMDKTLDVGQKSIIVPAGFTTKTEPTFNGTTSKVIEEENMANLQQFVHHKMRHAGNKIYEGDTSIKPYSLGTKTACKYCNFKSVCQFDQTEAGNSFNELQKLKDADVFETIKEVCSHDNEHSAETE